MNEVDAYLAKVPVGARAALTKLRKMLRTELPRATEQVRYGIPTLQLAGRGIVGFGAGASHCALYAMSGTALAKLGDALGKYEVSKGTIRFPHAGSLPVALVRRVVKIRLEESAAPSRPAKKKAKKNAKQKTKRPRSAKRRLTKK
jgi:uncharacterized protein YdhG (YjbR/CyaY superfamily)